MSYSKQNTSEKFKCAVCGQTNLSAEEEVKLITICKNLLPEAYKTKTSDKVFKSIIGIGESKKHFDISLNTLKGILKDHGIVFDKGTKSKKEVKKSRYSEIEYQVIIDAYESKQMGVTEIVSSKLLGERTPPIATVNDILRRKSKVYQENNKAKSKVPDIQKSLILALFGGGTQIKDIVAQTTLSKKTVESILYQGGIDLTPGKTDQEKLEIYYFYINFEGKDATGATCEKFDISATRVRDIVREIITNYELEEKDNSNSYRKYTLDQDFFSTIDTEEKAYILFLIATDGNVSKNVVSIELQRTDKLLLERVSKCIRSDKPIMNTIHFDKRSNKYTEGAKVSFISTKMAVDLAKYGIIPNKSLTLDINMSSIRKDLHRHCWRGGVDGDGAIFTYDKLKMELFGTLAFCSSFKHFIETELNISVSSPRPHHSIWVLSLWNKDAEKVAYHLYKDATIFLRRKMDELVSIFQKT